MHCVIQQVINWKLGAEITASIPLSLFPERIPHAAARAELQRELHNILDIIDGGKTINLHYPKWRNVIINLSHQTLSFTVAGKNVNYFEISVFSSRCLLLLLYRETVIKNC